MGEVELRMLLLLWFKEPCLGYTLRVLNRKRRSEMKKLLTLAPIAALLTACEDAGNSGDDNLLTGESLVLVVIIVVVIVLVRRRR